MVKEAGGTITDCEGGQDMLTKGSVCVGNEAIQPALLNAIKA
jgi:myo-inositol-1(or 4)-monophosphatase